MCIATRSIVLDEVDDGLAGSGKNRSDWCGGLLCVEGYIFGPQAEVRDEGWLWAKAETEQSTIRKMGFIGLLHTDANFIPSRAEANISQVSKSRPEVPGLHLME